MSEDLAQWCRDERELATFRRDREPVLALVARAYLTGRERALDEVLDKLGTMES